eukprot:CAMPEP_0183538546 /NCGR_PEP_ID=MMETSP0371-20130417/29663_1 /TAXON_ID=268820 /ORGANISM="Peridinium aciculiferum, Strain PAER-2" /LENGTH=87 /DNA_ID=CAMNT_0025739393 /DNA_START=35 /DNA_END=295 /DNA_ORIENTATION=+
MTSQKGDAHLAFTGTAGRRGPPQRRRTAAGAQRRCCRRRSVAWRPPTARARPWAEAGTTSAPAAAVEPRCAALQAAATRCARGAAAL